MLVCYQNKLLLRFFRLTTITCIENNIVHVHLAVIKLCILLTFILTLLQYTVLSKFHDSVFVHHYFTVAVLTCLLISDIKKHPPCFMIKLTNIDVELKSLYVITV